MVVKKALCRLLPLAIYSVTQMPNSFAAVGGQPNAGVEMQNIEATSPRPGKGPGLKMKVPERPPMNAPVGNLQLSLKNFKINGNTVFSTSSLAHLVKSFEGSKVSFTDLLRAANTITDFYRDSGYLVARAYIPEQTIQEGVVEIVILEGLIGDVNVNNEAQLAQGLTEKYLEKAKPGTVVSEDNVERALLLLNDLPGVSAQANFKLGKEQGTTDLDVTLSKTPTVTGSLDANNFGSEFTGEARIGGSLYVNNLMKLGDVIAIRALSSEDGDTIYGGIDYSVAVGGSGARLGIRASNLESDVGEEFSVLDLQSEASSRGLYLSYPWVRSRDMNTYAQVSLERRDVDQLFGGALASTNTNDDVSVLSVSLSGDYRDAAGGGGLTTYGMSLQSGLDDLEVLETSRPGADGKFFKADLTYRRLQYLTEKFSVMFNVSGQYSSDPLVSSEQFSLGGPGGVRAFVNGEGLADAGIVFTTELRRDLGLSGGAIKHTELAVFYDYGHGKINDAAVGVDSSFDLSGLGIGLKIGVAGNYQIQLSYAHSTSGEASNDDDDGQFLIQAVKWLE